MNTNNFYIFLFISAVFFSACNNTAKKPAEEVIEQISKIDTSLLIGSWEDQSESALHFTLRSDGTAQSDNMTTLLYSKWEVKNNLLYLVAESVGNGISYVDTMLYEIQQLDEHQLLLKRDDLISTFKKGPSSSILKGHYIYGHEVRSFSPCGSAKKFWIIDKTEELKNRYERAIEQQGQDTAIFVEIEIIDKGKANDGFARNYESVYEVVKILNITEKGNKDCE